MSLSLELPQIIEKGWGREIVIENNKLYCGKILQYDHKGAVSSAHFHLKKTETFYVTKGKFLLSDWTYRGEQRNREIKPGTKIHIPAGEVHQLHCLEDGSEIFEVSTPHSDDDVVRIAPGDSQK